MTLRAGISGCGPSGRALVAAARVAGLGSVIAAHDDDDAALATLRSATPVGTATTDFAALLATGVDFVVLAGPLAARLAQVRAAAEQAVPVLATAPIAASAAEAAAMLAACREAEVAFGVHVDAFADPVHEELRRMVQDGWFGALVAVHAAWPDDLHDAGVSAFARFAGALHAVPWCTGRRVRRIGALAAATALQPSPLAATAELTGGVVATLAAAGAGMESSGGGTARVAPLGGRHVLPLVGTDATASLCADTVSLCGRRAWSGAVFAYDVPGEARRLDAVTLATARARLTAPLEPIGRFARWLEQHDAPACPSAQAEQDLRALAALDEALASGRIVDVP